MVVVPIREREHNLLIVEIFVRIFWVIHYESSTEAVRVLSSDMRMVPVCARLVDLGGINSCSRVVEVHSL